MKIIIMWLSIYTEDKLKWKSFDSEISIYKCKQIRRSNYQFNYFLPKEMLTCANII